MSHSWSFKRERAEPGFEGVGEYLVRSYEHDSISGREGKEHTTACKGSSRFSSPPFSLSVDAFFLLLGGITVENASAATGTATNVGDDFACGLGWMESWTHA